MKQMIPYNTGKVYPKDSYDLIAKVILETEQIPPTLPDFSCRQAGHRSPL